MQLRRIDRHRMESLEQCSRNASTGTERKAWQDPWTRRTDELRAHVSMSVPRLRGEGKLAAPARIR